MFVFYLMLAYKLLNVKDYFKTFVTIEVKTLRCKLVFRFESKH